MRQVSDPVFPEHLMSAGFSGNSEQLSVPAAAWDIRTLMKRLYSASSLVRNSCSSFTYTTSSYNEFVVKENKTTNSSFLDIERSSGGFPPHPRFPSIPVNKFNCIKSILWYDIGRVRCPKALLRLLSAGFVRVCFESIQPGTCGTFRIHRIFVPGR